MSSHTPLVPVALPANAMGTQELIALFGEIAGRAAMYDTKEMHDRFCEIRRELESRIVIEDALHAHHSERRETLWIPTSARQPEKDGRLWAVLTEQRRDGKVIGYIPTFEYYHFIDGWATDDSVIFWLEADLHPLPKAPQ